MCSQQRALEPATEDRWLAFAWLWGLAAVIHVLRQPLARGALNHSDATGLALLAVGAGGVLLMALPRSTVALAGLAALSPVTAWLEAPRVGNHWVLVALVDLGILGALAVGTRKRSAADRRRASGPLLFPATRAVFVMSYAFAALSKYNRAFVDPRVSCANIFTDDVAHAVGLPHLHTAGRGGWAHLVPIVVILIETAVVTLVAVRRTRTAGVILGLTFHGLISLNQRHPFADYSAVVVALLVLFLPDDVISTAVGWWRHPAGRIARMIAAAWASAALTVRGLGRRGGWPRIEKHLVDALWFSSLLAVFVSVVAAALIVRARTDRPRPEGLRFLIPSARWLLVPAVLALLNGLAPYAEVKTGYSWNMYSNLVTAGGHTNSFLVPRTLHLSHAQDDPAHIVESADPVLQYYGEVGYDLPWVNLREYTATHPDTWLVYVRDGVEHRVDHTSQDPELSRPVPSWQRRLFPLRALDSTTPAHCEQGMLPAA